MRIPSILLIFTASFLGACSNKKESLQTNLFLETLNKMEKVQKNTLTELLHKLDDKKKDPQTAAKAMYWSPVTDTLVQYISALNLWFDSTEEEFAENSNYTIGDKERQFLLGKMTTFNDFISDAFNRIAVENDYIKVDIDKLKHFVKSEFLNSLRIGTKDTDTGFRDFQERSSNLILADGDREAVRTSLRCIRADFNFAIQQVISYLDNHTNAYICGYDVFRCIISTNYSTLKRGEELEILAGMGSFSYATKPKFFISGVEMKEQDGEPFLVYKKKINESPGSHSIPVTIEFLRPDGTSERITKSVIYQVLPD